MLKGYTVSLCSNHGRGDTIEFNFVLLLLVNISPELYNFLMQLVYVCLGLKRENSYKNIWMALELNHIWQWCTFFTGGTFDFTFR